VGNVAIIQVRAKADLMAFPATWTKGEIYEVVEGEESFSLSADVGNPVKYVNSVKDLVLEKFEVLEVESNKHSIPYRGAVDV
jgi:hypothetical protein